MKKFGRFFLIVSFLVLTSVLTVFGYELPLEQGELLLSIKPLAGFGNPEEITGEIPYYYAGTLEVKYAVLKNLEFYVSHEGYNPGTEFSETFQKTGISIYLAKGENFGMRINAESLLSSSSLTPYTIMAEISLRLFHKEKKSKEVDRIWR